MDRPKPTVPAKRVWRISATAPMGAWVENVAPVIPKVSKDLPEVSYGSWVTSSYDLLNGTDVTDDPDTIPGELFDEWFAQRKDAPNKPQD